MIDAHHIKTQFTMMIVFISLTKTNIALTQYGVTPQRMKGGKGKWMVPRFTLMYWFYVLTKLSGCPSGFKFVQNQLTSITFEIIAQLKK